MTTTLTFCRITMENEDEGKYNNIEVNNNDDDGENDDDDDIDDDDANNDEGAREGRGWRRYNLRRDHVKATREWRKNGV